VHGKTVFKRAPVLTLKEKNIYIYKKNR